MADTDLELHVKTSADLTALKVAQDEIEKFYASAHPGEISKLLAPVPEELLEKGGAFGTGTAGYEGLTHAAAETERIARNAQQAGTHFATAAMHAGILLRGLESGNVNLRSISVLAHSIGLAYAGAAAAGIALNRGISEYTKLLNASTAELDKQGAAVVNLAKQWETAAKSVLSPEDIQRVAEAGIGEIDKMGQAATAAATKELTTWQSVVDKVTLGFKQAFTFGGIKDAEQAKGAIQQLNDETARGIGLDREALVAAKAHQIELARATEKTFETLKDKSSSDAITELSKKITDLKSKQDALADSGHKMTEADVQAWIKAGQEASLYQKKLDEILKLEQQRHKDRDTAIEGASVEVKRVMDNEAAAAKARKEGRDKDAELYTKSAEAYERGLKPAQQAELENIRKLEEKVSGVRGGPPRTVEEWRKQQQALTDEFNRAHGLPVTPAGAQPGVETGTAGERKKTTEEMWKDQQEAIRQRQNEINELRKGQQPGLIEHQTQQTQREEAQDPELKKINDELKKRGEKPISEAQKGNLEVVAAIKDLEMKLDRYWG